ncbi:TPA: fimbrial protein [Salmonella enterica subsp. salamae serovar 28:r:e,n,z15]|nr:fimbrial protein [Salmonella enterica subsp. salamae serovar 28:r:e,n,z15]
MESNKILIALSVSAVLFSAVAGATITGTDSAEMTFEAEVTSTTCSAQIVDAQGSPTNTIDYGQVFKSEIEQKSRTVPFNIVFNNCSGVDSVEINTKPGAGGACSGDNSDGESFAAGHNAAFELWSGDIADNFQLTCSKKYYSGPVTIDHTTGVLSLPFTSRIVVAKGKDIADVTAGAASAPVTFLLTYR